MTVPNRMCTSISDLRENSVVVALVKFPQCILPELSEDPLGAGDDRWWPKTRPLSIQKTTSDLSPLQTREDVQ